MTLSSKKNDPIHKRNSTEIDEAQTFLVKNGFHQATKGLIQDIKNTNGIYKKGNIPPCD